MTEINLNKINDKYLDYAKLLENTKKPESLDFDNYNRLPMDVSRIDYGNVKLANGSLVPMFVATSASNEFRVATLSFSEDGINWIQIEYPDNRVCTDFTRIKIHNGSVFVIIDCDCMRFYDINIDGENSTMQSELVKNIYDNEILEVYDLIVCKNVLWLLSYEGVYMINNDNKAAIDKLDFDYPLERFIQSSEDELVILAMCGNYPAFIVYDGEKHIVFCPLTCTLVTAIVVKDKIYCYTNDARIVILDKVYSITDIRYDVYNGHNWTGDIYYKHACFWMSYTELGGSDGNYTMITKSINGINFDPDVKIPYHDNDDGISVWGDSHTYCICAGNMYTLISSENYFDYGNIMNDRYSNIEIPDNREISIQLAGSITPDIDKCTMIGELVTSDGQMRQNTIQYERSPYIDEENVIHFTLIDGDYTDLHLNFIIYEVKNVW